MKLFLVLVIMTSSSIYLLFCNCPGSETEKPAVDYVKTREVALSEVVTDSPLHLGAQVITFVGLGRGGSGLFPLSDSVVRALDLALVAHLITWSCLLPCFVNTS